MKKKSIKIEVNQKPYDANDDMVEIDFHTSPNHTIRVSLPVSDIPQLQLELAEKFGQRPTPICRTQRRFTDIENPDGDEFNEDFTGGSYPKDIRFNALGYITGRK